MLVYTTIQHEFRKAHGLSCNEYVILDMVNFLCQQPGSKVPGWCWAKKESLASEVGMTKQGLLKAIDRLIAEGFLSRNEKTRFIQTTDKWRMAYFDESKQSLPGVNKVDSRSKQSLPLNSEKFPTNNNTSNDNNTAELKSSASQKPTEEPELFPNYRNTEIPKSRKTPAREVDECYADFQEIWLDEYPVLNGVIRQAGGKRKFLWDGVKGKKLNDLIRITRNHVQGLNLVPTRETVVHQFKSIIAYVKASGHFVDGKPLTTWVSQYPSIINEKVNGKPTGSQQSFRKQQRDFFRALGSNS